MKKLIIVGLFMLVGCKTVNVNVYNQPDSGAIDIEVHVKGSDVEADARLK